MIAMKSDFGMTFSVKRVTRAGGEVLRVDVTHTIDGRTEGFDMATDTLRDAYRLLIGAMEQTARELRHKVDNMPSGADRR